MKKIIVIKIGSSILLTKRGKIDEYRVSHIASQVSSLQEDGFGVVLVVSGAVACGHRLVESIDDQISLRQAASGIGQAIVTSTFTNIFHQKKLKIAQVLLTKNVFYSFLAKQNLKQLLEVYAEIGAIAMVNENDVLDLNGFGGNDLLAVEIAALLNAEKMVMLSTMKGSLHGVGGGATKQQAVKMLAEEHIETSILDGKKKNILLTI